MDREERRSLDRSMDPIVYIRRQLDQIAIVYLMRMYPTLSHHNIGVPAHRRRYTSISNMSESLESITLDEYLNAQQHKDAISAGISSVWGDSWDDDLELKERVLPAHLMETRDGLLWLAKNVVEQARFTEDLVNLLGKARSDALDL
jgi:hypothetical protein